jgi:hypothetical protein
VKADEGEWKIELKEVSSDYESNPEDTEAIHAFHDCKIATGQWSDSLDNTELFPEMKISS